MAVSLLFPILCCEGSPGFSDAGYNVEGTVIEGIVYVPCPKHYGQTMVVGCEDSCLDVVTIKEKVELDGNDCAVIHIDDNTFEATNIKSITMPNVTSIHADAIGPDVIFLDTRGAEIEDLNELHGFTYTKVSENTFKATSLLNVFFDENGGRKIDPIHADDGKSFKLPTPGDRSGFSFVG